MILVALLMPGIVLAQAGPSRIVARIDSLLTRSNRLGIFNGTVFVARRGQIIDSAARGFSDGFRTERLTPAYRFSIGSIVKEFSAAAIMLLQDEGRLRIESKVSTIMPELPAWAARVTVRDLLKRAAFQKSGGIQSPATLRRSRISRQWTVSTSRQGRTFAIRTTTCYSGSSSLNG